MKNATIHVTTELRPAGGVTYCGMHYAGGSLLVIPLNGHLDVFQQLCRRCAACLAPEIVTQICRVPPVDDPPETEETLP